MSTILEQSPWLPLALLVGGGRDRKGAVVAHRGRRRHAAQALRQTSRTEA
ncbi:hypothetical protein [Intrasporangium flavum]|nr:hypothetical protein [Intrasporangium flavum]